MNNSEFIEKIGVMAREDMKKTKILASLTIAQAILESNWGRSSLAVAPNNNLFGIKGSYNGQYCTFPTSEYINGKWVKVNANFRKYPSWAESIADHSALFNNYNRYANLRGCTDYKLACKYVREDGYATDPSYTNKLINLIEGNNLQRFDLKSNNQQTVPNYTGTITYQAYANGRWYEEVNKCDSTPNGYAGDGVNFISGVRAKPQYGEIIIQSHLLNGSWLAEINSKDYIANNTTNGNSYSGIYGKPIDAIKIHSTKGYVDYRVKTKKGWLPWVRQGNDYAGNIGEAIIGIQMK